MLTQGRFTIENMDEIKKARLEAADWTVADTEEFLEMDKILSLSALEELAKIANGDKEE